MTHNPQTACVCLYYSIALSKRNVDVVYIVNCAVLQKKLADSFLNLRDKRREPDLNRWSRCCRPVPYHLAMAPSTYNYTKLYVLFQVYCVYFIPNCDNYANSFSIFHFFWYIEIYKFICIVHIKCRF